MCWPILASRDIFGAFILYNDCIYKTASSACFAIEYFGVNIILQYACNTSFRLRLAKARWPWGTTGPYLRSTHNTLLDSTRSFTPGVSPATHEFAEVCLLWKLKGVHSHLGCIVGVLQNRMRTDRLSPAESGKPFSVDFRALALTALVWFLTGAWRENSFADLWASWY